ncbi:hypothetical protein Lal_00016714 [Lupinus albus]|nr:hypothetical protein Lal_00016714 [Lupinus albus]
MNKQNIYGPRAQSQDPVGRGIGGFEEVEKIEVRRGEKVRTRERIAPRLLRLLLPPFPHRRPPCFDHVLITSPFHSLERGFKSLTPQSFVSSASGNSSGFPTARRPAVTAHNSLLPRFEAIRLYNFVTMSNSFVKRFEVFLRGYILYPMRASYVNQSKGCLANN